MRASLHFRSQVRLLFIKKRLHKIGIKQLTREGLVTATKLLSKQIQIGIERNAAREEDDGGLYAIPSSVPMVTVEDWKCVPLHQEVLACGFGGTNWEIALVEKISESNIKSKTVGKRTIAKEERQMTFSQFITLMADTLFVLVPDDKLRRLDTIAISFGFIFESSIVPYGIDAKFLTGSMRKFWKITDYENILENDRFLGKALLDDLHQKGLRNIQYIYFQNDTNAVANNIHPQTDVPILEKKHFPVGFVFGTGANASLTNVNLEAGHAHVLAADLVLMEMARSRYITPSVEEVIKKNYIEYWIGGDNMRFRVVSALHLCNKLLLAKKLLTIEDPSIISQIAMGIKDREFLESLLDLPISRYEWLLLQYICHQVLTLAGQLMGTMIAATIIHAGYHDEVTMVPIEGSVFWKGFQMHIRAKTSLDIILPENKLLFVRGSGVSGVAELALILRNKKELQ